MESLTVAPLRAVKLTNTKEKILLTKEDNFSKQEWEELKARVLRVVNLFPDPLKKLNVEIKTAFKKDYISLSFEDIDPDDPYAWEKAEAKRDFYAEWSKEKLADLLIDLVDRLQVELLVDGYSVKRFQPQNIDKTIQERAQAGNPVVAHFLVENDCITVGVPEIIKADISSGLDFAAVMQDIADTLQVMDKSLVILSDPFVAPKEKTASRRGQFINGPAVYGVVEITNKNVKPEEVIVSARTAKKLLEKKGYKVVAERAIRIIEKLDL